MQSSANSTSEVVVTKAELSEFYPHIRSDADSFYVWYEWDGSEYQRTFSNTIRKWRAKAMYSGKKDINKRGGASRAAVVVLELRGASKLADDIEAIKTANDTLDNLTMVYFMQHNRQFETEKKLTRTPI